MGQKDLRENVILTTLNNADVFYIHNGKSLFKNFDINDLQTQDRIFIESEEEIREESNEERKVSPTDYAIMNNCNVSSEHETKEGKNTVLRLLKTARGYVSVFGVNTTGELSYGIGTQDLGMSICPRMQFKIPQEGEKIQLEEKNGKHIIKLGEYPKTKVDDELAKKLEHLYHGGDLKDEIVCTGRWYTVNAQNKIRNIDFLSRHNPEFEYDGNRYVRVMTNPYEYNRLIKYNDGTECEKKPQIRWVKVEPISFIIKNWDDMPIYINAQGNGTARYFDLKTEEAIIANIPYCPEERYGSKCKSSTWKISMIRAYLNGLDSTEEAQKSLLDYGLTNGKSFSDECNFLNEAFNLSREPIKEYYVSKQEREIPDDAFNGCITLKKIIIPQDIKKIGKRAFSGLTFKYAYKTKDGNVVFDQELPEGEFEEIYNLEKYTKAFLGFDYTEIFNKEKMAKLTEFAEMVNKNHLKIPYSYALELIDEEIGESFFEGKDFRFFRNEIPELNDMLKNYTDEEQSALYKFANALGCFSNKKMFDNQGKETEIILGQKATSFFSRILKTDQMHIGVYEELFKNLPANVEPNPEFLKFIFEQDGRKMYPNLDMILGLNKQYPDLFANVLMNFDAVKNRRNSLDENGKPIRVPWAEALKSFNYYERYENVSPEDEDIAELFAKLGLSKGLYDLAVRFRNDGIRLNIPEHILEQPLEENNILDEIEQIKHSTEQELINSRQLIEQVYDKQFTYEWLNKRDPRNSILGIFCDCCATISSAFYGQNIAIASVREPDIQNLIIKDAYGKIVAKGTLYVDKQNGFGVINTFEVNSKYRHNMEKGKSNSKIKEEQEREKIFEAFQRGVKDFVEVYNKKNPEQPIKQVNVGIKNNKLCRQIERLKEAILNVQVPSNNYFEDAIGEQRVLYEMDTIKEEEEREI